MAKLAWVGKVALVVALAGGMGWLEYRGPAPPRLSNAAYGPGCFPAPAATTFASNTALGGQVMRREPGELK